MLRFIKIERGKGYVGMALTYDIAIDGAVLDSVAHKQTKVLPITEERHTLKFVVKGQSQPEIEIPAGNDSLVFEAKIKMGLITNHLVPKYIGTFDGSSVNIDECSDRAVWKCCDAYIAEKEKDIMTYIHEFRSSSASFRDVTEKVALCLLQKELIDYKVKAKFRDTLSSYDMFLYVELDDNGTIKLYNCETRDRTYCTDINISGWNKEKRYAFKSFLAESVVQYWLSSSNYRTFRDTLRAQEYTKISLESQPFEKDKVSWSYKLDAVRGFLYSIDYVGRIWLHLIYAY